MTLKKDKPGVSICIPAYNQPESVKRALESIVKQKYKNFEVIITDDSENDLVKRVVNNYSKIINIRYYKNKEKKGTPENWNEAIRYSNGEYIKMLHHDDWFPNENCLQKYIKMLDDNAGVNFAFSGSYNYDSNGKMKYIHKMKPKQQKKLLKDKTILFFGNFIGAPSATIFKKNTEIYFDNNLKWLVDIDFYITILNNNKMYGFTYEPLIAISINSPNQVTSECLGNRDIEIFEYLYLYNKYKNPKKINFKRYKYIWNLFERYGVYNIYEIREILNKLNIESDIKNILFFQKIIRFFKRLIEKARLIFSIGFWFKYLIRLISYIIILITSKFRKKK